MVKYEHIVPNSQNISHNAAHSSFHTFSSHFHRPKVRNWPEKSTLILMMSEAKTSLIWLHTNPSFPLFGIEEMHSNLEYWRAKRAPSPSKINFEIPDSTFQAHLCIAEWLVTAHFTVDTDIRHRLLFNFIFF